MTLDLSDDEELGEFIYRTSRTAKLLREKKDKEDEVNVVSPRKISMKRKADLVKEGSIDLKKAKVKTEDDVSTDDEQQIPGIIVSSPSGYDPVKTDDEELGEDINNTSNEQLVKEVKTEEDDSTDDERSSEKKEPVIQMKLFLPLIVHQPTTKPYSQQSVDNQHTR